MLVLITLAAGGGAVLNNACLQPPVSVPGTFNCLISAGTKIHEQQAGDAGCFLIGFGFWCSMKRMLDRDISIIVVKHIIIFNVNEDALWAVCQ